MKGRQKYRKGMGCLGSGLKDMATVGDLELHVGGAWGTGLQRQVAPDLDKL